MGDKLKALVTGGSGFIGSHLIDALLDRGWDVRCLIRRTSSLRFLSRENIEFAIGDLDDPSSLTGCIEGADVVFHLAGRVKAVSRDEFFRANWRGTKNILKAAASSHPAIRAFIYASSLSAAGPSPDGHLLREDEEPRPVSFYGESKLAGEREAARFAGVFPVAVLRPTAVYGPREGEIFRLIKIARRGIRVGPVKERNLFSAVHVADVAQSLILAAETVKKGIATFFIGDGATYPWGEAFDLLLGVLGVKRTFLAVPWGVSREVVRLLASLFPRGPAAFYLDKMKELRHNYWVCDISRARAELGFKPRFDLRAGVEDTVRWYREQGWLH